MWIHARGGQLWRRGQMLVHSRGHHTAETGFEHTRPVLEVAEELFPEDEHAACDGSQGPAW